MVEMLSMRCGTECLCFMSRCSKLGVESTSTHKVEKEPRLSKERMQAVFQKRGRGVAEVTINKGHVCCSEIQPSAVSRQPSQSRFITKSSPGRFERSQDFKHQARPSSE